MPPYAITVLFSVIGEILFQYLPSQIDDKFTFGQAIVVGLLLLETVRPSAALYGRGKASLF